jgi:hypothetical protein
MDNMSATLLGQNCTVNQYAPPLSAPTPKPVNDARRAAE